MLEKLLLLIAAGAAVTVTSGGVAIVRAEQPSPSQTVEISEPTRPPLAIAAPPKPSEEDEREQRPEPETKRPAAAPAPATCVDARDEARKAVQAGYARFHAAVEQLRGERAADTIARADAMLREIAEKADRALGEMGGCGDLAQVAERAVAAMETVFNVTKSAATPKPTERPRPTEKPKPKKTPSCDERVVAPAKKLLGAAFEHYHSKNDELWEQAEALDNDAVFTVVKNADHVMHTMYDQSKEQIARAGCAEGLGMQIAQQAATTFERAYSVSKAAMDSANR